MTGSGVSSGAMSRAESDGLRRRVLRLTGEMDISVRDVVDRNLRAQIEGSESSVVIVDLSAVTFMDSSGLDPLLRVHAELAARERVLALEAISRPVARLFRLLAWIRPYGLVQQTLSGISTATGGRPDADDRDPPGLVGPARDLQAEVLAYNLLNEAIGLMMEVHDCNAGQARLLLALVSHHHASPVADLAAGIVAAAEATQRHAPASGLAAMVPAGVRAALGSPVPAPRAAPGCSP